MAEGASSSIFMRLLFLLTVCTSEISPQKQFNLKEKELKEEIINYSPRVLHNQRYKTTQHATLPTTPVTVSPGNNPAPTIITVPATIPGSIPVTLPSTNPINLPVPITNPVTTPSTIPGAQQGTNPTPSTATPSAPPVTNSVPPPATTGSSSAVPGQSWCVAKSGSGGSSLQAALDYACGIGGADCSRIQQGSSCYNPNSIQNHASYAFNSYYQKNPVQTSCDFGGTAVVTNINPSTGTCIYPSSSPSSSPMTTIPTTPTPATMTPTPTIPNPTTTTPAPITTTAAPTTTSSSGATVPVFGPPPAVLNTSNPASGSVTGFGQSPPSFDSSTSMAIILQPFIGCIVLVISVVT